MKKKLFKLLLGASVSWSAFSMAQAEEEGIAITAPKVTLKIGGRIQFDAQLDAGTDGAIEGEAGKVKSGTEMRRARLFAAGTLNEVIKYKLQFEFADNDTELKDAWLSFADGRVLVGRTTQSTTLDDYTSSKYITFIERALPVTTFAPGRTTGIHLSQACSDGKGILFLEGGVIDDGDGSADFDKNAGIVSTRAVYTPVNEGEKVIHLAGWYAHIEHETSEETSVDEITGEESTASMKARRYRTRPEAHISPRLIDTGVIEGDASDLFGLEAVSIHGPLSFQGEYIFANVDTEEGSNPLLQGFYAQGSYFLTGEHRNYSEGQIGRVKINNEYGVGDGLGAWEVAARLSYVDLDDEAIEGGEQTDFTFGLNWYATKHARLMLNYILADVSGLGEANLVTSRMQVDF